MANPSFQKLASDIAKKEAGKKQVRIGDVREILGILSDMFYSAKKGCYVRKLNKILQDNGERRFKEARKKGLK